MKLALDDFVIPAIMVYLLALVGEAVVWLIRRGKPFIAFGVFLCAGYVAVRNGLSGYATDAPYRRPLATSWAGLGFLPAYIHARVVLGRLRMKGQPRCFSAWIWLILLMLFGTAYCFGVVGATTVASLRLFFAPLSLFAGPSWEVALGLPVLALAPSIIWALSLYDSKIDR